MGALVYRFAYLDFWVPVWPNIAASVLGWLYVDWRHKVRQLRHHEDLKQHVTATVNAALKENQ